MTAPDPRLGSRRPAEAPPTSGAMPVLSHRQILTVLVGLMLGMLVAALSQTIVATALPTIVGELGGQEQLAWVVTATLLASTVSTSSPPPWRTWRPGGTGWSA